MKIDFCDGKILAETIFKFMLLQRVNGDKLLIWHSNIV